MESCGSYQDIRYHSLSGDAVQNRANERSSHRLVVPIGIIHLIQNSKIPTSVSVCMSTARPVAQIRRGHSFFRQGDAQLQYLFCRRSLFGFLLPTPFWKSSHCLVARKASIHSFGHNTTRFRSSHHWPTSDTTRTLLQQLQPP